MSRAPMHETAKQRLADLHAVHGRDTAAVLAAMRDEFPEFRRAQVESCLARIRYNAPAPDAAPAPPDDAARWRALADAEARRVSALAESLDWLRPVEMAPPPRPAVRVRPSQYTLVVGDPHFGCHDEATLTIVGLVLEALKPKRFIWNGDVFDLLAVSRYPKDARRGKTWTLRDEVAAFQGWQRQYQAAADAWGCAWYETHSNHSGDSEHGRWWRYLSERCGELLQHPEAEQRLRYEAWFYPDWAPITHVPSVAVGDLLVLHGYRARMHGGTTARAHAEDYQHSVVTNHTHRLGSGARRVPAVAGRAEGLRVSFETGCACTLNPHYTAAPPDWASGFGILCESGDDAPVGVELVAVVNGAANVAALGRTVRA